jgi:hypothetical protein
MAVLNQYILYFDFFVQLVFLNTNVASIDDTCLDIIKLKIIFNCIMDSF